MTRDDEHEERGILGRLRRRRSSSSGQNTAASNMFTARAEPPAPVSPPPEPPPERLFDGVDRWDEERAPAEDDPPLFSEAEGLDAPPEPDDVAVPPPPPVPAPPVPSEPMPRFESEVETLAETPLPPAPHDPPPAPSGPIDAPAVLDAPPPPDAPLFGPVDDVAADAPDVTAAPAAPAAWDEPASLDPDQAGLAELTDELHRYAAEDLADEPEQETGLWSHLAEPFERRGDDAVADEPGTTADAGALASNLFVDPPKPTPPPVHLTDEDLSGPAPTPAGADDDLPWTARVAPDVTTPAPVDEPSFDQPAVAPPPHDEPAVEQPAVEPLAPEEPAVAEAPGPDEPSPLLDQIAREFGDPRHALHQLVDADLDSLPPAASAPPEPSVVPEPELVPPPPPVVEEEIAEAFPPEAEEAVAATDADELLFASRPDVAAEPEPAAAAPVAPEPEVDEVPVDEAPADVPDVREAEADEPAAQHEPVAASPDVDHDPDPVVPADVTGPIPLAAEPATHGPSTIRVHDDRLENRPGPIKMSPSEAVTLAQEGPRALKKKRPKSG